MKKLISIALLAVTALFSTAALAGQPTSKKVYATPAVAARNIIASKLTAANRGYPVVRGSQLNSRFLGLSANGKARQYQVTNERLGVSRKISVLKVVGGWKAYR
jgi:hypothetical protein